MSIDTRTPAEIAYDNLKSGAAYIKDEYTPLSPAWEAVLGITSNPRDTGSQILDILTNDADAGDDEIAIAQWIDRTDQPFGTLTDGTVIYGTFDTTAAGAGKRSGCVTVRTPAINLTADCDGFVSGENGRDDWSINFDGASLEDIRKLRDFLNSGAVERMLAAAVAWENGDSEPPVFQ
jgi:hypothetical protein